MNLLRTKSTASVRLQLSTLICFCYWLTYGQEADRILNHFLQCPAADWFTNTLLRRCGIHDYSLPNGAHLDFNHWKLSSSPQLHQLPVDAERSNGVRIVRDALFSRSDPTPFAGSVELAAWSDDVLENILNLNASQARTSRQFVDFVSGNAVHHSSIPLSHRYGGHQFGVWAGQLGDGRAHLLGEYWSASDGQRWELQLKGSGKTPYSRDGDGRAVLRSSVREFLASEAMHYLGIPSSRAATLVRSSEKVKRDPLYNGKILSEPTAVVLRVSQSWFRFGSFEILAKAGEFELLRTLADFVIVNYFPTIRKNDEQRYASLFEAVVDLSARTAAKWHGVGFAHGVLNTDNMSILGLTIDYGPFRFVDVYDPELVPNGSDDEGRYRYRRQPAVVRDNLRYLFVALASIMSDAERKRAGVRLERFESIFQNEFVQIGLEKLGFGDRPAVDVDGEKLVDRLLKIMSDTKSDFTATFRQLSSLPLKRLISASAGDRNADDNVTSSLPWSLRKLVKHERFGQWALDYRTRLQLSAIGEKRRRQNMLNVNPQYVLRNWMAQEAIAMAEGGDYSRVRTLARILRRPFADDPEAEYLGYSKEPPSWSTNLTVTCSS